MPWNRRRFLALTAAAALSAAGTRRASAQEQLFVSIGTGGTGGTYLPVGGLIASAISNPPGSRDCKLGGSCGVPGLIASAVSTQGSVENVRMVAAGRLDMALCQADVAYFAFFGKGVFAGDPPLATIRAIANLYPETVHIVARRAANVGTVAGLKGHRVSVGERGSGTLVVARTVLGAFGLKEPAFTPVFEKIDTSAAMLLAGEIDALFMVGGYPIAAVAHAADGGDVTLIGIPDADAERIIAAHPFLVRAVIPAGTYAHIEETSTLSVGAQLIVSMSMNADLVYGITAALWHAGNRRLFEGGPPNTRRMRLEAALDGIAIPLHPGAARFYEEVGLTRADIF